MTQNDFFRRVNSPWRMWLFLLWKLPAAWFMGVRVVCSDEREAVVALPYGWRSQNPFRSIYFAAQCAAAELSTGLLGLAALQGRPPVSMLVLGIEAEFLKKADQTLRFVCSEGEKARAAVEKTLENGQPQQLRMESVGYLPDGTEAARVRITWSFKRKS